MEIIKVNDSCYICRVKVDRSRSNLVAINATGHALFINPEVVDSAPRGESEMTEVIFFRPESHECYHPAGFISDEDFERALTKRGLIAAPLDDVAAVNEADHTFVDGKPHCTHWKDASGNWCRASFNRWSDGCKVCVYRYGNVWNDRWFFAGVRLSSQS